MKAMREQVKDFRKLKFYEKMQIWVGEIRELVKKWKWEDRSVVGYQIRKSSTSVVANLVEGNSQLYYQKEINFLNNSLGSLGETQYWLDEAYNSGLIDDTVYKRLDNESVEIRRIIISMIRKVEMEIANKKKVA